MNKVIETVLTNYMPVYKNMYLQGIKNNKLELVLSNTTKQKEYKYLIETDLVNQVEIQIQNYDNLKVKGRTFQSKWAAVP